MTSPRPTAFLDALAVQPLDVYGVVEALGIDHGTALAALRILEEAGTIERSAANVYSLTDAGRSAVAESLTASMFPERVAAGLVASMDDHVSADARALVAAMEPVPGYVTVQRVVRGVVTYTSPSLAPGIVASLADARRKRAAHAADSALTASLYSSPRVTRSRAPSTPSRRSGGAGSRAAAARALIAAAPLADAPDGAVLSLPGHQR